MPDKEEVLRCRDQRGTSRPTTKPTDSQRALTFDRLPVLRQALQAGRRTLRGQAPSPGSQHLTPGGSVDLQRVRCPDGADPHRGAPRTSIAPKVAAVDTWWPHATVRIGLPGPAGRCGLWSRRTGAPYGVRDRTGPQILRRSREPQLCDDPHAGLSLGRTGNPAIPRNKAAPNG